jgi:hypothetical protein
MKEDYLALPDKASPSDKLGFYVLILRLAPYLGLGVLGVVIGYNFANLIPLPGGMFLFVIFIAFLVGMTILDAEPGWNLVLFLGFSLVGGTVLYWSPLTVIQNKTWVLFLVLILVSLLGGAFTSSKIAAASIYLMPGTILYFLGWILFLFFDLPELLIMIWTGLGLALFTLIAIAILSRGKTQDKQEDIVPLVIQIFVVVFNLFWLSTVFQI